MRRAAFVGLLWSVAAVAHAQIQGPLISAAPAAPAPVSVCTLMLKAGDGYTETPLVGFDPANTSVALPVPAPGTSPAMVSCNRTTIIPEVTDYRILTEMHLPLAIVAGSRTLLLGATSGRFQVGLPDGQVTTAEKTALQDRLDQMETAFEAAAARKR